jgi:hypothetical protein
MLAVGLVLFSAFCRMVGGAREFFPEPRDLLLIGPLPGLALVALLLTILSLLHLVRLWVMVPLAVLILIVLRQDTLVLWNAMRDSAQSINAAARRGDLLPTISLVAGVGVIYAGLFLCYLPAAIVDVWAYHLPLAQSIASQAGFAYPQINHLLFGTQPMALEMMHGAGLVVVGHFAIAGAINLAIYLGLLLLLLSFSRRARPFLFLVLCALFVERAWFFDSATPMIDTPRACLSIAAFLFAYRYACNFRRLDLVLSGLMAGFAAAAKTTELLTTLMICATLAPLIWHRRAWSDLFAAGCAFTAIAGYWYVKNLVLYGNPIYPFLFGHPGLSDAWMRDTMLEMTRPMDPADRVYSTNLLTVQGWHDFAVVLGSKFDWLQKIALLTALGLFLPQPRRWMLPLWSALLFLFWYARMFNHIRWALTAVLLLTVSAFLVGSFIFNRFLDAWHGEVGSLLGQPMAALRNRAFARYLPAAGSAIVIAVLAYGGFRVAHGGGQRVIPTWMDRNLLVALTRSGDPEKYLNDTRPDYQIYRYIGRHDLARVFQPFDDGGVMYASAYNDGEPNRWMMDYRTMPARLEDVDAFLARNKIRYFIQASSLSKVEVERLGPDHVALADRMIGVLKPRSQLVISDRFGNRLYEIRPEASGKSAAP